MPSIFDTLADLPLFKGVSHEMLARTVGRFRFEFKKFSSGETIVNAGNICCSLIFILSGESIVSHHITETLNIKYTLTSNNALFPEFMFGRSTSYPAKVVAAGEVGILEISKADYTAILASDNIFLFNYLNFLSQKAQSTAEFIERVMSQSLIDKLEFLVESFTQKQSKDIIISTKGNHTLPEVFFIDKESFKETLSELSKKSVVEFDLKHIHIARRQDFL